MKPGECSVCHEPKMLQNHGIRCTACIGKQNAAKLLENKAKEIAGHIMWNKVITRRLV